MTPLTLRLAGDDMLNSKPVKQHIKGLRRGQHRLHLMTPLTLRLAGDDMLNSNPVKPLRQHRIALTILLSALFSVVSALFSVTEMVHGRARAPPRQT